MRQNQTRKRKKLEIDVKDFGVGRFRANFSPQQKGLALPWPYDVALREDLLTLLRALPGDCSPLVFFDPQQRDVLDKLKFGNGAVQARFRLDLPIPSSWSARKRAAAITGEIVPTGKPDLDNLLRSFLDGIRTIVIDDDAVIVGVRATKRYGVAPLTVCTIGPSATPTIAPVE